MSPGYDPCPLPSSESVLSGRQETVRDCIGIYCGTFYRSIDRQQHWQPDNKMGV